MAKFVFIYKGGMPGASKEEQDKIMEAWGKWFQELGDSLVDGGNPFGPAKAVSSSGQADVSQPASGFSIVNAADQAAACDMAKGCPVLQGNAGARVEVYEAFPM